MNKKNLFILCGSVFTFVNALFSVILPEFKDKNSGFVCLSTSIEDDFVEKIYPINSEDKDERDLQEETKECLKKHFQDIVSVTSLKDPKDVDLLTAANAACQLMSYCDGANHDSVEGLYVKFLMRAALMGNPTAIYEILNLSHIPSDKVLKENFSVKDRPMTQKQFISMQADFCKKCEEASKVNFLAEILAEL